MNSDRDKHLLSLRPNIAQAKITKGISPEEEFQNTTLRSIIKYQHDLIIQSFKSHLRQYGKTYYDYSQEKRKTFITDSLSKNIGYKNFIRGIIIGHFTSVEFEKYQHISKQIDRRITGIVRQRLLDSMEELVS